MTHTNPRRPTFSLYYNSLANRSNWRNNYQRSIQARTEVPADYPPPPPVIYSSLYSTADAACISGWNEIKNHLSESWVQGSVAAATSDTRCSISKDGITWRTFPIRIVSQLPTGPAISYSSEIHASLMILTRQDGRMIEFRKKGGNWSNESDSADALEELLDSSGNTIGWKYADPQNDEIETYDASGKLVTIANRAGISQTLSYDASGNFQSVFEALLNSEWVSVPHAG